MKTPVIAIRKDQAQPQRVNLNLLPTMKSHPDRCSSSGDRTEESGNGVGVPHNKTICARSEYVQDDERKTRGEPHIPT
jgi:hypothetical protein